MKALILAAGYGTRLEKDISIDDSGQYVHLKGLPKPLLPVGNKLLIDFLIDNLNSVKVIDSVYIVTNNSNYNLFREWASKNDFPVTNLVNDGTTTNEKRMGAIKDINLVLKEKKLDDDLLVVAGDTLFYSNFNLSNIVNRFKGTDGNLVTCYKVEDEMIHKTGILEFNENKKVTNFLEKPSLSETNSRWGCPPLYFYKKETLPQLDVFLNERRMEAIKEIDAPGMFVSWLYSRKPLYAFPISGRFDVGGLEDYKRTNLYFKQNQ
jgi:NDP-sugar pyrophosphorylase family protein